MPNKKEILGQFNKSVPVGAEGFLQQNSDTRKVLDGLRNALKDAGNGNARDVQLPNESGQVDPRLKALKSIGNK